ncbi:MAG: AgmX/PglI C-terminal domain-containing protein [Deltaproteobacteria bacterium]|nr:AgmX/PglI C-terminal domain-containing protein [Deltaproteobacteria bacterium]
MQLERVGAGSPKKPALATTVLLGAAIVVVTLGVFGFFVYVDEDLEGERMSERLSTCQARVRQCQLKLETPANRQHLPGASAIVQRGLRVLKEDCYQRALRRNPNLRGMITVVLTLNALGKVTRVEFDKDTVGDGDVTSCVKEHVKRWRFPAPDDGKAAELSFSVGFTPTK